ncbi:MAG: glycosyltransferase family 2 protein [Dysgonomonas sp.]|nr:glycosyltransferase family 2 protein [Dysgonomonas sp.]
MKLSVIIVNYNVKYFLEQCLNSVLASKINFDYEIFIVDNNSTDNSLEYLRVRFTQSNIHYIANKDNPGFAVANNQAIKQAKGEYILLLNPDTVLGEHILAEVCNFLDNHQDAGGAGVKAIDGTGKFLAESKRGFPTPWASFCKLSGLESLFPKSKIFGKYSLKYLDENKLHKVPILVGSFIMIRKSVLDKTGLLDEAFFMYGEDIDLSFRIIQAGYNNYYLPEKIIHYKGESTDKSDPRYTQAFYDAMRIFFRKYYPDYSKFYSLFISAGISLKAFFAPLNKKRVQPFINEERQVIILNTKENTYEEIIDKIDNNTDKNIQFRIYNPDTGIEIGHRTIKQIN